MANTLKREFKVGQYISVVDCCNTNIGTKAIEVSAYIFAVDEAKQTFNAGQYVGPYHTYSFKDYGRLIFDNLYDASNAAEMLPKPQTNIYHVIGKRVYKKLVLGIIGQYTDGTYDLVIRLNKGKNISTKEMSRSLFINESDARRSIKK